MNFKNTKKQGDYGLGKAIAYFTEHGYTVCIPLTDSQDYDLVIEDKDGTLKKVQVKTSNNETKYGGFEVTLRVSGGNSGRVQRYANSLVYDLLFVTSGDGHSYLIPKEKFSVSVNSITVGNKWSEYRVSGEVRESHLSVKQAPSAE